MGEGEGERRLERQKVYLPTGGPYIICGPESRLFGGNKDRSKVLFSLTIKRVEGFSPSSFEPILILLLFNLLREKWYYTNSELELLRKQGSFCFWTLGNPKLTCERSGMSPQRGDNLRLQERENSLASQCLDAASWVFQPQLPYDRNCRRSSSKSHRIAQWRPVNSELREGNMAILLSHWILG